jgi:RNA polymerase sigma factor (TIGR02999 family)
MDPKTFTQLLIDSRQAEGRVGQLFDLLYDELYKIAHRQLHAVQAPHTLNTAELINEAFVRMVDRDSASWQDRAHFCAYAARAMRAILIDRARRRMAQKRGGGVLPETFREEELGAQSDLDESRLLIEVNDALSRLEEVNERLARVVECRFFGAMTVEETAGALGVTDRTVRRDWLKAKTWLHDELTTGG